MRERVMKKMSVFQQIKIICSLIYYAIAACFKIEYHISIAHCASCHRESLKSIKLHKIRIWISCIKSAFQIALKQVEWDS